MISRFGPNSDAVNTILKRAQVASFEEVSELLRMQKILPRTPPIAARVYAWEKAQESGRKVLWNTARDAVRLVVWDSSWAVDNAVVALIVQDLISPDHFKDLSLLWTSVIN